MACGFQNESPLARGLVPASVGAGPPCSPNLGKGARLPWGSGAGGQGRLEVCSDGLCSTLVTRVCMGIKPSTFGFIAMI